MFEIKFSGKLITIQKGLNEQWLDKIIKEMPFPISYPLRRAREEGYPWYQVLEDLLHAILHYTALLAVSEYVASGEEPDFDINEVIQERIGRSISEGHWLSFIRICVKKRGRKTKLPLLNEIYQVLEGNNNVKLTDDEYNVKTGRLGLLSAWIKLRNTFVHGPELSEKSKKEKLDEILRLVKSVLYLLQPLSQYHYCHRIKGKTFEGFFDLTGVENFKELKWAEELAENEALLIINEEKKEYLPLFPLYISYKGKKGIIREDCEVYLINTIEKQKPSQYLSPAGSVKSPEELQEQVIGYFSKKRVYEKRRDIKLEEVYHNGLEKNKRFLDELVSQGLYTPDKYVEREEFKKDIKAFLSSGKKAIIISGESGSGKTSSLIHLANNMLLNDEMPYMVRCEGLPASAIFPEKLEGTLVEELGFNGSFAEIIDWFDKKNKRFNLIFEALNEFVGPGKDLGRFFESINSILSRYRDKKCLKILMSTTSETVPYFLNEQKVLPESMAEEKELYFHGEEGDIYGFRKFNEEELKVVAKNYDVPYWAVEEVRKNKKIDLLNPRQFRIFAELFKTRTEEEIAELKEKETHQKIVNEMLKYSGYKLANKHINRVLKKEKKLLTILEMMARFMDKQKDLSPTWSRYEDKHPKLASMLKENNWEKLRKLKELQLIKEERMSGSEGIGDWKLSFAHDRVYDLLMKKVRKKSIIDIFLKTFMIFSFVLILTTAIYLRALKELSIYSTGKEIEYQIKQNIKDYGPVSQQALKKFKEYENSFKKNISFLFIHIIIFFLWFFTYSFFLFSISIVFGFYIEDKMRGKQDKRIQYMVSHSGSKISKKMSLFMLITLIFIVSIALYFIITGLKKFDFILFTNFMIYIGIFLTVGWTIGVYYIGMTEEIKFVKNNKSRSLYLYLSDRSYLILTSLKNFIALFAVVLMIGIFLLTLSQNIPMKFTGLEVVQLNQEDPAYKELIEKEWILESSFEYRKELVENFEKIYSFQFMTILSIIKYAIDKGLRTVLLIFIFLMLLYPFFKVFLFRKKLGPLFR